ncbi:E3 ubiquitin/ISG15 ligase TRIM25-like isoform X2 [Alosa sapidissima]|uniref:E3 ubiquitin/ISG15 ligase TRIM25-like isoform X2 n=1 Tax=Alosa sapidissima TaxID=34773 RepID=UPI001C09BCD5|nr:E3 ubiquitin/ISG15 ligase TRIM25-like isoform X2 [Alosa sapidissima]
MFLLISFVSLHAQAVVRRTQPDNAHTTMADDMPSLLSLEAELTCSICLNTFENPVTLPCGHNFCQGCLDESWKESFILFCPQCRHLYPSKPELKKNTVLSAVVETFKKKASPLGSDYVLAKTEEIEVIKCDTCMTAKAFKTCLTCMASFCEEHIRPHMENPIFRPHQLTNPLGDLRGKICQDHNKIMEFFCQKHDCCICAICLQQFHRDCEYTTPQERRAKKESEMTDMLRVLDRKIDKNSLVMAQITEQQLQLQDDASAQKKMMSTEYQFIRYLIDKEEQDALKAVDKDLESGQTRIQSLIKKFGQNVEKMSAVKMELNSLLSRADSLSFLQASTQLASSAIFDPYCPHVNMESKALMAYHSSAVAMKELLSKILTLSAENRFSLLKPGQGIKAVDPTPVSPEQRAAGSRARNRHRKGKEAEEGDVSKTDLTFRHYPLSKGPTIEAADPTLASPVQQAARSRARSRLRKGNEDATTGEGGTPNQQHPIFNRSHAELSSEQCSLNKGAHNVSIPRDISTAVKRSDLLKFSTVLKLDPWTAHKRIVLTDDFTKASMAEEPRHYPDGPKRFVVCSQVLCSQGFLQGHHYWEVKISRTKSCGLGLGLGLAYGSIDRRGPGSRLGLNSASWCMEWFNDKLSAWHDAVETVLGVPGPSHVGVLLDCDGGSATFYAVADRAFPLYTFVFPFKETVYPAFWIFSAGCSISLCKLTS